MAISETKGQGWRVKTQAALYASIFLQI